MAVGSCTFEYNYNKHTVTIEDDGNWKVDPPLDGLFSEAFSDIMDDMKESYGGPSDGPFGPKQLAELARRLDGTYELEPKEEMKSDTIY